MMTTFPKIFKIFPRVNFSYMMDFFLVIKTFEYPRALLMGHFGVNKTLEILEELSYWLHLQKQVSKFCEKCRKKAKSKVYPMACILLFQFQTFLGKISPWILWLDCLDQGVDMTPSLWLWIDFQKWHILYHATDLMMHLF